MPPEEEPHNINPEIVGTAHTEMRKNLQRDIRHVVTGLKDIARQIDYIALEMSNPDDVTPYASLVARVQHEVMWGMANLNIDRLTREAANLEQVRAMEKQKEKD